MLAQLRDINGKIRYTLGAQIDVSNLVPDSTDLDGAALRKSPQIGFMSATAIPESDRKKDETRGLSEMLDVQDRRHIQKWRARTTQEPADDDSRSVNSDGRRPRILVRDLSSDSLPDNDSGGWVNSKLSGFYQNVSSRVSTSWPLLKSTVSSDSPLPIFACSLRFSISANTWHVAITHSRQNRR